MAFVILPSTFPQLPFFPPLHTHPSSSMPRISILRLLSLIPLFYICATGLWLFLPSPVISHIHREHHIQSTDSLSGKPLTTIHGGSSPPPLSATSRAMPQKQNYFAITYQLQPAKNSITLFIDDAKLNLTDDALRDPPYLSPAAQG